MQALTPPTHAMRATQGDAEGEEGDTAEGVADNDGDEGEDEDLSPLVCIIPDRSSVTEGNLYGLVFTEEMR